MSIFTNRDRIDVLDNIEDEIVVQQASLASAIAKETGVTPLVTWNGARLSLVAIGITALAVAVGVAS